MSTWDVRELQPLEKRGFGWLSSGGAWAETQFGPGVSAGCSRR